jgi:hypothetical protein
MSPAMKALAPGSNGEESKKLHYRPSSLDQLATLEPFSFCFNC